jgi:large subunit ribosomal protein L7/L12
MNKIVRFGCSTVNKLESELNKLEKITFKDRYLSF